MAEGPLNLASLGKLGHDLAHVSGDEDVHIDMVQSLFSTLGLTLTEEQLRCALPWADQHGCLKVADFVKAFAPASPLRAGDAEFFRLVDAKQGALANRLLTFPGVSDSVELDAQKSMLCGKALLQDLGASTWLEELGGQPPVLLATLGEDPGKATLVVNGHLDSRPEKKGPVFAWIFALEALEALGREVPVNIRFVIECMGESGSIGLQELVIRLGADGQFLDPAVVDFVCTSNSYYTGKTAPCLSHAMRGMCYFHLEVGGLARDADSGVNGGMVHEAMTDCVQLLGGLVDSSGNILVDGLMDKVKPLTATELRDLDGVEFDVEECRRDVGVEPGVLLLHSTKEELLAHGGHYPTLSLHGIEGAFSEPGDKAVIPGKVVGKFSVRLVPPMEPEAAERLVRRHVDQHFARLRSANKMQLRVTRSERPWYRSPEEPALEAAAAATRRVHGLSPAFTREGGSIPMVPILETACQATCVLLPIGASGDEKLDRRNLHTGVKMIGCFMEELSLLPRPKRVRGGAPAKKRVTIGDR